MIIHGCRLDQIVNPNAVQMAFATRILGFAIELPAPTRMYAALEVGGAARSVDGGTTWELVNRYFDGNVDLMDLHGVAIGSPRADVVCIANRTSVCHASPRQGAGAGYRPGEGTCTR